MHNAPLAFEPRWRNGPAVTELCLKSSGIIIIDLDHLDLPLDRRIERITPADHGIVDEMSCCGISGSNI